MTPTILTYCWAGPRDYRPWQVNVLARLCRVHMPEHRFVCVTDGFDNSQFDQSVEVVETPLHVVEIARRESPEGGRFPSSYRRLWTFSNDAAEILGELVMLIDVDCIPCGWMWPLFERQENFVGWRPRSEWGVPGRLAGGTWLHRPGTMAWMWDEFFADPAGAVMRARDAGCRGSDQAIMTHRLAAMAASWEEPHGIYQSQDYTAIRRPARRRAQRERHTITVAEARARRRTRRRDYQWTVPADARLLHFNGPTKPWHSEADFVKRLWVPYALEEPGYLQFIRQSASA